MRRRRIPALTLVITLSLVLAGCVQPAPGDGTAVTPQSMDAPPLPPASPSSSDAEGTNGTWAPDVEPCVDEVTEPHFDGDAEVTSRTEPVPANITHAVVRVGSYLGGIYVAPWDRDAARVEVGESDPDGILEPTVTLTTRGSTLVVDVVVERTGSEDPGPLGVDIPAERDTYAAVKVRIPDLPVESLHLRDMPEENESEDDAVVWFRTDWRRGGWGSIIVHDVEAQSLATQAHLLDTTMVRVRATATALAAGTGDVHMHRFAARNTTVDGGSGDPCLSLVRSDSLRLHGGSGYAVIRGADTHRLHAEAGSVALELTEVRARVGFLSAGSGSIDLENVRFARLGIDAGSGDVEGHLVPLRSGDVEAHGGSGSMDLTFPAGPNLGYLVHARSGSGHVDVHITNGTVEEDDGGDGSPGSTVTGRTHGFEQRPVQVHVNTTTGSGQIDIEA